jgi:type I restriction enzyme S subunit
MTIAPPTWTSDRLKDVAAINASSLPANTDPDYEFDYLEISNVDYHGIVDPQAIERLRYEDAPSRARRRAGKNCTLVSSVRPNLQAVAFLANGRRDFVCSTGFNVVQPLETKLAPKFAHYALISEGARQYFEATAKGVGYPAVDDKDFNSFAVPLPPLLEQQRIAA